MWFSYGQIKAVACVVLAASARVGDVAVHGAGLRTAGGGEGCDRDSTTGSVPDRLADNSSVENIHDVFPFGQRQLANCSYQLKPAACNETSWSKIDGQVFCETNSSDVNALDNHDTKTNASFVLSGNLAGANATIDRLFNGGYEWKCMRDCRFVAKILRGVGKASDTTMYEKLKMLQTGLWKDQQAVQDETCGVNKPAIQPKGGCYDSDKYKENKKKGIVKTVQPAFICINGRFDKMDYDADHGQMIGVVGNQSVKMLLSGSYWANAGENVTSSVLSAEQTGGSMPIIKPVSSIFAISQLEDGREVIEKEIEELSKFMGIKVEASESLDDLRKEYAKPAISLAIHTLWALWYDMAETASGDVVRDRSNEIATDFYECYWGQHAAPKMSEYARAMCARVSRVDIEDARKQLPLSDDLRYLMRLIWCRYNQGDISIKELSAEVGEAPLPGIESTANSPVANSTS